MSKVSKNENIKSVFGIYSQIGLKPAQLQRARVLNLERLYYLGRIQEKLISLYRFFNVGQHYADV